ncbi:hypothetical protein FOZ62_016528, partial [Perkinsus olseni]
SGGDVLGYLLQGSTSMRLVLRGSLLPYGERRACSSSSAAAAASPSGHVDNRDDGDAASGESSSQGQALKLALEPLSNNDLKSILAVKGVATDGTRDQLVQRVVATASKPCDAAKAQN